MRWKLFVDEIDRVAVPQGYSFGQLRSDEVSTAVKLLRAWYPDIVVGSETCHLDPSFYAANAYLLGGDASKNILPVVIRESGQIVLLITFERNEDARTITSRMGAIDPAHRGRGLSNLGPVILEQLGRAIGAELAYYFVTLKTVHQQLAAEKAGFRIVGIVPAFDRDSIEVGKVKRVFEAIYSKVLVGADEIFVPPASSLTPGTRALWDRLFPDFPV